jgi:outer membrane murein-binding lipoprotein Lpp
MKASTMIIAALVLAAPSLQTGHAQGLLDRLKRKADDVADAARDLGGDIDDVTSVDEQAASRVEAAERDVAREAERTVGDTAPARAARDAERGLRSAEGEVLRADAQVEHAASADDRAAAEARRNAAALERELDVETRARNEVRDTARAVDTVSRADEIAAAEAERRVDGALDPGRVERRVDEEVGAREAQRSLENAGDAIEGLRRRR